MSKLSKKKLITLITAVIMSICVAVVAVGTNGILERKESKLLYNDFFQNSLNEDIVFIGTSRMSRAVKPMDLWSRYGYASYVMIAAGDGVNRYNAMLEMIQKYTKPKLIVLDVEQYWETDELSHQLVNYHRFSDAFPLSATKIKTTLDLYEDNGARAELLFPWLFYHSRWNELTESDFRINEYDKMFKGSFYDIGIGEAELPKGQAQIYEEIELELEGLGEIEKFVETCKKNDIEVLLVFLPYTASEKGRMYGLQVNQVAEKCGVAYINFNENCSFLDEKIDYKDKSHMNISGSEKMTEYLGKYISENYDIPDRRTEPEYSNQWGEDYAAYCDWKKESLKQETDLKTFLLRCCDVNLNYMLYMKPDSECYRDRKIIKLIRNILPLEKLKDSFSNEDGYFAVLDCETGEAQEFISPDQVETMSSLGTVCFWTEEGNKPVLSIENMNSDTLAFEQGDDDIYIWAFDKTTGELACKKSFKRSEDYMSVVLEDDQQK